MKCLFKWTQFAVLMIIASNHVFAQNLSDSIVLKKEYRSGSKYFYHGKEIKMKDMMNIMKPNPQAYKEICIAESSKEATLGLVLIGGGLAIYSFSYTQSKKWPVNWLSVGVGSGLAILGIPYYFKFSRHKAAAIQLHNAQQKGASSYISKPQIHFGINNDGPGLKFTF